MRDKLPPIHIHLPKQKPMTKEQIVKICSETWEALDRAGKGNFYVAIARAIEKHHGITESPSKESFVLPDGSFTKSSAPCKNFQE